MHVTIQVKKQTKDKLSKLGSLASTYDSVISELIEHVENCQRKSE